MADQLSLDPYLDDPEKGLNALIAKEEQKVGDKEKFYSERRSQLAKAVAKEFFSGFPGAGETYTAQMAAFREQLLTLQRSIVFAKDQDPEALLGGQLPARALVAYRKKTNPEMIAKDWLESLKSQSQKDLEKFIFGAEKPPKISQADENKKYFDSGDWTEIIRIYQEEALWLEQLIAETEGDLLRLYAAHAKEMFFPSQPDKTLLEQLEKRRGQYLRRRDYYRRLFSGMSQGRWSEEEIERAARDYAREDVEKGEEKEEQTEKAAGGERIAVQQAAGAAREPAGRAELSVAQRAWRRAVSERATAGGYNFRDYLRHPSLFLSQAGEAIKGVWQKAFGKKVAAETGKAVAAEAGKKVVAEGAKVAAGGAIKRGLAGLAAKVGLGAISGGVLAAALLVKDALGLAAKILPRELREGLKDLWTTVKIGAAALAGFVIFKILISPVVAVFTGAGTLLLPFLGPIGPVAGFGLGLALEGPIGGIINSLGGTVPAAPVATTATVGGFSITSWLGAAGTNLSTLAFGTGVSSIAFWAIPVGISVPLIASLFTVIAVASTPQQEAAVGQTRKALFTLRKEAVTAEFPDFNSGPITVRYELTFQAGLKPIKIESIRDILTRSNSARWSKEVLVAGAGRQIAAGETGKIPHEVVIAGREFEDSRLFNAVEIAVSDAKTGEKETQNASAVVSLGRPPVENTQPFGYPASGAITSLDLTGGPDVHTSCFMIFRPCRWIDGGMDITPRGGDLTVYATMRGKVKMAQFLRSGNGRGDVGGVVYLENGPYVVEYMHLDESVTNLKVGDVVEKGMPVGKIYTADVLGAVTGPHVHYQVLFNGANLFFDDSRRVGQCSEGKVLPTLPALGQRVGATMSQSCD